jgi:5'-deoxynucleotidase YfbR-like HD superfamily hydrolase
MAITIEAHQRDYLQAVPPKLLSAHDQKMAETPRWVADGRQQSKKLETNLDHLEDSHGIADEIFSSFSKFTAGIDKTIVHQEIHLHDTPEIITGDDAVGNKDHKAMRQRRWEMERIAFALLTGEKNALTGEENIPDPNLRQGLRDLYKKYNDCRPARWKTLAQLSQERAEKGEPAPRKWETLSQPEIDAAMSDRESLLAHFIDKIQASRYGIEYVFENDELCKNSVDNIVEYAVPLFRATPAEGRVECIRLVLKELERFKDSGFAEPGIKGRSDFLSAISALT